MWYVRRHYSIMILFISYSLSEYILASKTKDFESLHSRHSTSYVSNFTPTLDLSLGVIHHRFPMSLQNRRRIFNVSSIRDNDCVGHVSCVTEQSLHNVRYSSQMTGILFYACALIVLTCLTHLEAKEEAGQRQCCPASALTCSLVLLVPRRRPLV